MFYTRVRVKGNDNIYIRNQEIPTFGGKYAITATPLTCTIKFSQPSLCPLCYSRDKIYQTLSHISTFSGLKVTHTKLCIAEERLDMRLCRGYILNYGCTHAVRKCSVHMFL